MHFNFTRGEYNPSPFMRVVQISLLILILIGIGLLVTQKVWVPKLVEYILSGETNTVVPVITEVFPKEESVVVPSTQNTVDPKLELPVVAPSPVTNPKDTCHIGGCSGQLCTDQPDMVSTCEYRMDYACYQTAECKRQTSGQCGWTETSELRACLDTKSNDVI
ncbi:MAG: hypothetical protein WAW13_02110 [Minisyncoccia bacterium]